MWTNAITAATAARLHRISSYVSKRNRLSGSLPSSASLQCGDPGKRKHSVASARELAARFRAYAEAHEQEAVSIPSETHREQLVKTAASYRRLADRIERDPPRWLVAEPLRPLQGWYRAPSKICLIDIGG